jgi:hypothetical protein
MATLRLLIAGLLLIAPAIGFQAGSADGSVRIDISATPIPEFEPKNPSRVRFGDLEFRGGLILTSSYPSFGGFSALRVLEDGSHFIALSDRGSWLCGRIVYQGERPAAIADAVMARVLDTDGKPSSRLDTESLTEDRGMLYVGVERLNEILRYDYGKKGLLAAGEPVAVPPGIKDLPFNQGLEALVFVPDGFPLGGTLVAFSEWDLDEAGNLNAFLIGGPRPGNFCVKRTDGFAISDAALLPDGDFLTVERKYTPQTGTSMRIRRLPRTEIKTGAIVDGRTVVEVDSHFMIDNTEALSVHSAPSGELVVTLLSDDNFSRIQKTILLQFTLVESRARRPQAPATR